MCVDAEAKFPCRIRVNHHLTAVNPDQLLSALWSHVSRRLWCQCVFSSISGVGVGFDLHTKLFSPSLCSCTACGKSNCLHQSEVFISLARCRCGVTPGHSRKCWMEILLCRICAEDAHIVVSLHRWTSCSVNSAEGAEAALNGALKKNLLLFVWFVFVIHQQLTAVCLLTLSSPAFISMLIYFAGEQVKACQLSCPNNEPFLNFPYSVAESFTLGSLNPYVRACYSITAQNDTGRLSDDNWQ